MISVYNSLKKAINQATNSNSWQKVVNPLKRYSRGPFKKQDGPRIRNILSLLLQAQQTSSISPQLFQQIQASVKTLTSNSKKLHLNKTLTSETQNVFLINKLDKLQKNQKMIIQHQNDKKHKLSRQLILPSDNKQVSVLEQVIKPIKNFIQVKHEKSQSLNQMMNSIGMLQKYITMKNKKGFGGVTFKEGDLYLGRSQQGQGFKVTLPLQKVAEVNLRIPDIQQNFDYLSKRAINKWNQFVSTQSQLRSFVSKINSQQKRSQYIYSLCRRNSNVTWKAQVLATLVYYYYRLPCYRIFQLLPFYVHNLDNFIKNYQITQYNPLMLSNQQSLFLALRLFVQDVEAMGVLEIRFQQAIQQTYRRVMSFLATIQIKNRGKKPSQNIMIMNGYVENNKNIMIKYYQSMGINPEVITQVLQNRSAFDINIVDSFFSSATKNTYLANVLDQVMIKNQVEDTRTQMRFWSFKIDSGKYPSKDYVWSYN